MPKQIDPFPVPVTGQALGTAATAWAARALLAAGIVAAVIAGIQYVNTKSTSESAVGSDQPVFSQSSDPENENGPFRFRFVEGDLKVYSITAGVTGAGLDMGDPEGVDMGFQSDLIVQTESVNEDGSARLSAQFDRASFTGDFMGSPYEMFVTQTLARATYAGRDVASQQEAKSPNPQLAFFQTPIEMHVAPDGTVTHIDGPDQITALLAQAPIYSDLEFPKSELNDNDTWTSEFHLPIPGIAQAPRAKIINRYQGTDYYGDRKCGVIHQQISSEQYAGEIGTAFGSGTESMGFTLPSFNLAGENIVYFDLENGSVVYSEMQMKLKMSLGEVLGDAGGAIDTLLQSMGDLVREDLPEFENFGKKRPGQESLLDLDLDIAAILALK